MKPTNPSRIALSAVIALTLWLNACSLQSLGALTPTPTSTLTPSLTPSPTPTETPTPTATPDPVSSLPSKVKGLFEMQNVKYEVGEKGEIIVEPYLDNPNQEKVILTSFERVDTDDGLNPHILTAKDKDGNLYAYNPDYGWFKVPEVYNPMLSFDWDRIWEEVKKDLPNNPYLAEVNQQLNPENYPVVEEKFITSGAGNITAALSYQSLPDEQKIPLEAPKGQIWTYYYPPLFGEGVLCVGPYPSQIELRIRN